MLPFALGHRPQYQPESLDDAVEQFLFRRQYREDTALRGFARECAFVTQPDNLLDLTVDQMSLHADAPWVALYEYTPEGFVRTRQRGSRELPARLDLDDLALVKLRAHATEVDLNGTPSRLGREGYAFPLRVRGRLLGILVVGPRSDEHYVADERELFAHVAHEVGAALFALRAQATEHRAQASEALLDEARARQLPVDTWHAYLGSPRSPMRSADHPFDRRRCNCSPGGPLDRQSGREDGRSSDLTLIIPPGIERRPVS